MSYRFRRTLAYKKYQCRPGNCSMALASTGEVTGAHPTASSTASCVSSHRYPQPRATYVSSTPRESSASSRVSRGHAETKKGDGNTMGLQQAPPHKFLQQEPANNHCKLQLPAQNIINAQPQPEDHLKGEHGLLSSLTHCKRNFIFRDHC